MGLAERRKLMGYSQESLAHALGVDRTTVSRWERGASELQAHARLKVSELLQLDLAELDALLIHSQATPQGAGRPPASDLYGSGDTNEMIRREFLRLVAVAGALASLPFDETEALAEEAENGSIGAFERMNEHLWQVYQLARSKGAVSPLVHEQLAVLNGELRSTSGVGLRGLCSAAGDLFQLAGELAFDGNSYTEAAASYTLAASASKEAGSFDLWACALVRHAYVDLYQQRYKEAADTLSAAKRVATRGDSALSTRHWVASVQAEAFAGLHDLVACERALDEAQKVAELPGADRNGGWLRFDGSRLTEERGARYVQLGRLDLAEEALRSALKITALAKGQSYRRRGSVLTDLAAIGAKRKDPDQVITYAREALRLAQESRSGYVARRLQSLRSELGSIDRDSRVSELAAEIGALTAT
ncbi:helix-turn-helix transcriptional regulator [Streptomyces sp. NPDC051644]|uniref:helix-turn-helix transcriptional regulator n=1 Tax=Streptomyces sp. NPDC051644 TaxID=3365666 RepID=UPI00378A534F